MDYSFEIAMVACVSPYKESLGTLNWLHELQVNGKEKWDAVKTNQECLTNIPKRYLKWPINIKMLISWNIRISQIH